MSVLYYVHDPMCSWCWAFRPVWERLQSQLPLSLKVKYLLGGLAPDSDLPMPAEMQQMIRHHWQVIEKKVPGTRFNYDFWSVCSPRRSTYPACRAVIAARNQHMALEDAMIRSIQHAYYLQARNPSDDDVLIALAIALGLDAARFRHDLNNPGTEAVLSSDILKGHEIGASGFPSLLLEEEGCIRQICIDYNDADLTLQQILANSM